MTDSAVAHLAGSLGKQVWVLLNRSPYWMWGRRHEDTPWYQSMRLFRAEIWNGLLENFDVAGSRLFFQKVLSGEKECWLKEKGDRVLKLDKRPNPADPPAEFWIRQRQNFLITGAPFNIFEEGRMSLGLRRTHPKLDAFLTKVHRS